MFTGTVIGRVTADLEPQISTGKVPYVRFNIAVDKGFGDNKHTIFPQCWLYGDQVPRIMKAKVKKGSRIWINGNLDLVEYEKTDHTHDKIIKIIVYGWGFLPVGKDKGIESTNDTFVSPLPDEVPVFDEVDGDNGILPG